MESNRLTCSSSRDCNVDNLSFILSSTCSIDLLSVDVGALKAACIFRIEKTMQSKKDCEIILWPINESAITIIKFAKHKRREKDFC